MTKKTEIAAVYCATDLVEAGFFTTEWAAEYWLKSRGDRLREVMHIAAKDFLNDELGLRSHAQTNAQ